VGPSADPRAERVLVFAVFGGDAAHTTRLLTSARIASEICTDVAALCRAIDEGAGAIFLAEEALVPAAALRIVAKLDEQAPWSDLPVLVSVMERELGGSGYGLVSALGDHANVTLLERPVSARAMITAVRGALRARRRQYQARSLVEELGRARDLAEASSRSKDEFLAMLSHELRTPLNAILGWTRMLRSKILSPERCERALATVERNAVAQAQLVEDLLDVSRAATGKLHLGVTEIDPACPVHSALEAVRPAAEAKRVEIQSAIDPGAGRILGDAGRLEQVMWNLLNNSIKFTPAGGTVHVTLARRDGRVEIVVSDDGPGIAPEFLPHVFERFRQADSSVTRLHGGLGIGLSIVKSIVELHGGSVEASSRGLGEGATFTVRLPPAPEAEVPPPSSERSAALALASPIVHSTRLAGLRVLVVDDEPEAADLMAAALRAGGASVRKASGAAEGYALLLAHPTDVLVSDIGMKGEDGFAFIQRVRALSRSAAAAIPALAVTAYARVEDRTRALVAGFDMHVAKPIDPAELVQLVEILARQFGERASALPLSG
jgi:signal transduction histidine kinase/ActR/RegA family two-component response regulator